MKTATAVIPSFLHEAITRHAISPRFAMRIFVIFGFPWESVGKGGRFNAFPVFCTVISTFSCLYPCFEDTDDEDIECQTFETRTVWLPGLDENAGK